MASQRERESIIKTSRQSYKNIQPLEQVLNKLSVIKTVRNNDNKMETYLFQRFLHV